MTIAIEFYYFVFACGRRCLYSTQMPLCKKELNDKKKASRKENFAKKIISTIYVFYLFVYLFHFFKY